MGPKHIDPPLTLCIRPTNASKGGASVVLVGDKVDLAIWAGALATPCASAPRIKLQPVTLGFVGLMRNAGIGALDIGDSSSGENQDADLEQG